LEDINSYIRGKKLKKTVTTLEEYIYIKVEKKEEEKTRKLACSKVSYY